MKKTLKKYAKAKAKIVPALEAYVEKFYGANTTIDEDTLDIIDRTIYIDVQTPYVDEFGYRAHSDKCVEILSETFLKWCEENGY